MAERKQSLETSGASAWAILLIAIAVILGLSLWSYDSRDISWLTDPPNDPPSNLIGPVGAWAAFLCLMTFGIGAFFLPPACVAAGVALLWLGKRERMSTRMACFWAGVVGTVALLELFEGELAPVCRKLNLDSTGGLVGRLLTKGVLIRLLSPVGGGLVLLMMVIISFVVAVEMKNIRIFMTFLKERLAKARSPAAGSDMGTLISREQEALDEPLSMKPGDGRMPRRAGKEDKERGKAEENIRRKEPEAQMEERKRRRLERLAEYTPPAMPGTQSVPVRQTQPPVTQSLVSRGQAPIGKDPPTPQPAPSVKEERKAESCKPVESSPATRVARPATLSAAQPSGQEYQVPPVSLLESGSEGDSAGMSTDTNTISKIIIETLQEFGIDAEVTAVEEGPVVTRYELLPAPGVRVEKISGLSNNLALALKATSVRVQAPVPGKGVVGIEVPNARASMVRLRDVLEGETWQKSDAKLPLVLGKDVGGNDLVADLANMPHLLVAGATGSGKTVCINSFLAGLLMAKTPAQLRLILVDPKIVEFAMYNNLPHLAVPVITNPKKVAIALRWAIAEMERRYKLFAKVGVRNIEGFNSREIATQGDLFGENGGKESEIPKQIPYIVIIIDELADLMLVDQAEIENAVARLAQLSRAVGIHMILSTQRPSVNVITGTIKANFPARIAFQVAQKTDSRTILDTVGAEKLLGRGDMLFLPPGTSKMIRAQGVFTTDAEISRIVDFIKKQASPHFELEIKEKIEKETPSSASEGEDEDLINQAITIIRETQRASTSSLQRRLRIGYTRAARIMDILEERGIVGPPRGSDAREILVDLDGEVPSPPSAPSEDGNIRGQEGLGKDGTG